MSKKASMAEVDALMAEALNLGADLRIPKPKDRPLVILEFKGNMPIPHRFRSSGGAKKWLMGFIAELESKKAKM
ncbi:MAG: hypothetical protein ACE5OZ_07745 [Candidatus Heimdallarchaeota archaeon]